ncbi:MAG: hypothetical protein NZV14_18890 [Bryobacteraceae bacterium]|nr:hypothetical protein [Bryobacteraceae bacterium]MDW8380232.1 type VI secretion protein IcmF/TssM N-terminal domain-containing protein [Bryobacterales bacterium]
MQLYWRTVIGYIFMMVCAAIATEVYKVGGEHSRTILYWLGLLGLTSTAFLYFFQSKFDQWRERRKLAKQGGAAADAATAEGSPGAAAEGAGDIDLLVKDAEAKLQASRLGPKATMSGLPVIFLVGDQNSTKTTVMVHSGLEPELLAGQIYQQDNLIVPTRSANFWFAKKAIFVEAGGPLWGNDAAWTRLLKKLAPPKLKSVFKNEAVAPRAALLCVDLERFLQPGASDAMAAAARGVQARLQEISTTFGINFPVYVLFTRADRVPFFLDFVRNLSNEEATQVFGVTLPMRSSQGGVYAEEETQRLNQMFNELFYSLCDKRIEYLPRENDAERLPGCYEFPREFRKLRASLVQFLVDVGRPSQLSTSPFLRGFYFTGVRPVIVYDVAPNPVFQRQQPSPFDPSSGATRMFKLSEVTAPPVAAPQQSGGRKVPQWVFLSHLFHDVILEDRAALRASEASTKTSGMQRALLALASLLALFWSLGMTISYFNNRALEKRILEEARQLNAVRLAANSLPSESDLKRLADLRVELQKLGQWQRQGRPFFYGFGLYVGDSLYPLARKAYYNGFERLLFEETQQRRMLTTLQGLQPGPDQAQDKCGYVYDTLRAYLITTSQWRRVAPQAEQDRLRSLLQARWTEGREQEIGESRAKAALDEFTFYSSDLSRGNPYSETEDGRGVHQARLFMSQCSGLEAIYNRLIGEASAANPTVNYNAKFPWTSAVVRNNVDIRGAFSKSGWDWMRKRLAKADDLAGEEWVLGPIEKYPRSAVNAATLVSDLWTRYSTDFIQRWRDYFNKHTLVLGYSSPSDAAAKLKIHSDTRAPVLYLIGLASQNTAVEPSNEKYAAKVREAFYWAHTIVPPGNDFLLPNNRPYVTGLQGLQIAVEAAAAKPDDAMLVQATETKKLEALAMVGQVATFSRADLEGKLDASIREHMERPIRALRIEPPSPLRSANAAAGEMCKQFNVITNKFPFNPRVKPEVTVAELNDLLQPPSGKFWAFYETHLKQFLQRNGTPVPGAAVQFNPQFLNFFSQVVRLSDALYKAGPNPTLNYSIQLVEVRFELDGSKATTGTLTVDGKVARLGGPPTPFVWTGIPSHSVSFNYNNIPAFAETGLWAIFRFFVDANVSGSGGNYVMIWPVKGGTSERPIANARFQVDLSGAPAVFDKNFLSGLRCIANVGK